MGGTLLAYVDESGDTGVGSERSSLSFTLGCVVIKAEDWGPVFDDLLNFRRRLKSRFGLPVRAEVKANYLIRDTGPIKPLTLTSAERSLIFRAHLRHMSSDGRIKAFAVAGHKGGSVTGTDLLSAVWTPLLQRLERTSRAWSESTVFIIHDEGENPQIRRMARWSRRRLTAGSLGGQGSLSVPFTQLLDDPMPKASHESYFIQLADLVAYSAFRRLYLPSATVAQVVPNRMWDQLGKATLTVVNGQRTRTAPGIVEVHT